MFVLYRVGGVGLGSINLEKQINTRPGRGRLTKGVSQSQSLSPPIYHLFVCVFDRRASRCYNTGWGLAKKKPPKSERKIVKIYGLTSFSTLVYLPVGIADGRPTASTNHMSILRSLAIYRKIHSVYNIPQNI